MFASEVDKSDQSAPIYMTISNTGGTAVGQLIAAQTPIVTSSDVVNSTQLRNGQERVAQIEIPINGQVEFKPTEYHVEVISLPQTLKAGDTFPLTLAFAGGDNRIITVVVRP
jgi:copper(I)-binding protein